MRGRQRAGWLGGGALAAALCVASGCLVIDQDSGLVPSEDGGSYAVCPPGVQPSFASIDSQIFQASCGTGSSSCHSAAGAPSGLVLQTNAYVALLGTAGQGEPANNVAGSATGLVRVRPGDPAHSFLLTKLTLKTGADPLYGSGMPLTAPGSVCPQAIQAITEWIAAGAPNN